MLRNNAKSGVYLESGEVDNSVSYNGGSSLKLCGKVVAASSNLPATARLFQTSVDVAPLLVSYTVLEGQACSSVTHCLQLQCTGNVVLLDPATHCTGKDLVHGLPVSGELPLPTGWPSTILCRLGALPFPHSSILHEIFTASEQTTTDWNTEYFIVPQDFLKGTVTTVGLAVLPRSDTPQEFTLNLGELKILDVNCISPDEKPSCIESLHIIDIIVSAEKTVALTLKWTLLNNSVDPITQCNIYCTSLLGGAEEQTATWKGEYVYLGAAYANCFRVCSMHMLSSNLREESFGLEFRVQLVTSGRRKPSVDNADCVIVWFTS
jgi:hypothetical protein